MRRNKKNKQELSEMKRVIIKKDSKEGLSIRMGPVKGKQIELRD